MGHEICSYSVGFFKYFEPEIDEGIFIFVVAVPLSRVPRSPESPDHLPFFVAHFSKQNKRFLKGTNVVGVGCYSSYGIF